MRDAPATTPTPPLWISSAEAAALLNICTSTFSAWIRDGKIDVRRLSTKYHRLDVERIAANGFATATEPEVAANG